VITDRRRRLGLHNTGCWRR